MSGIAKKTNHWPFAPLETRRRLLFCIAAFGLSFVACWYAADGIFAFLISPLQGVGPKSISKGQLREVFFVREKVAFISAVFILIPVMACQLLHFVMAKYCPRERRMLLPFLLSTPILFFVGAAIAYFVVAPLVLHLLVGFSPRHEDLPPPALPAVGIYLNVVTRFLFILGTAFLLPVLLMLLERARIVNRTQLIGARRYTTLGAFVIALVLSPPDAGSLLLIALTLMGLYEGSIVGVRFIEIRRARAGRAAANG